MILNTSITEKIEDKTKNDPVLKKYIENLIEVEKQGKNYKKQYEIELNKAIKEREGQ